MPGLPAFELTNVRVRYGELAALDGVSLAIGTGEAVALVGPSGAGKTTFLRLLNGTVRPDSGTVSAGGRALPGMTGSDLRRFRSAVGFVPQDFGLVPELRVMHNVVAGRVGRRGLLGSLRDQFLPAAATVRAVYSTLERVGIPEKLYERTENLSGGQQQRVAVARALFQEPDALLADEPVSSVDPARARATMDLLVSLARERGLTLVVSLHHVEIAREYFPRLVGLRRGRVAFDRAAKDLSQGELRSLYELEDDEILRDGPA